MREKLEMLLDELQYLKREGVSSVYCEEETLDRLKTMVKESIGNEIRIDEKRSDSRTSATEVVQKASAPIKKLNPFSPLPSDIEVLEKETVIEKSPNGLVSGAKEKTKPQASIAIKPAISIDLPKGDKQVQWDYVRERAERAFNDAILNKEAKAGSKMIFGIGNLDSEIFFCGDAPGMEEGLEGIPFGGESGQLLNKIVQAMGLRKENVYFANIINWILEVPEHLGERTATQQELNVSLPYLKAQIEIIKPKIIVALGAAAVNGLLGVDKSRKMGEIRGQWYEFQNTPLMITFHPSYLIRNNTMRTKRLVWEDMLKVMERLGLPISEKQQGFFK